MATYLNTFLSTLLVIPVSANVCPYFNCLWSALANSVAIQFVLLYINGKEVEIELS